MDPANRPAELAAISTVRLWCRSGLAQKIRETAGLTLAEAAELAATAPQTLYRWERNERVPRGDNAVRYHLALTQMQEITASANEAVGA